MMQARLRQHRADTSEQCREAPRLESITTASITTAPTYDDVVAYRERKLRSVSARSRAVVRCHRRRHIATSATSVTGTNANTAAYTVQLQHRSKGRHIPQSEFAY